MGLGRGSIAGGSGAVAQYTSYDPIDGGNVTAPASSAAELGLFAPAIDDRGGEIHTSFSFKSLNPIGGEGVYASAFGGFLPLSATQAKFIALLVLISWAVDFVVHDYVLMPVLDR
uniref:Uncharacterized protein n=1 Tax=Ananas comosus var. bracteatus TaxID=296719 RepID=A0A6V7PSY5_ANACO|nr:unnamed protein product [Ananas comosus var. bracteatus]